MARENDCISRAATVKRLCNLAEYMNEHKENSGAPYIMAALFIQDNKTEFPSVTPQEPRKAHWEHGRELSRVFIGDALRGINYEDWHCSNCHCVIEQSIKPKWNYCPNCGADMREVEV